MKGSLLLRFITPMNGSLVIMGDIIIMGDNSLLRFITPMNGSLVIMEGSMLFRFLLLQWMVALSLWKVVYCRDVCYSNGW